MKRISTKAGVVSVVILLGGLGGALSFWLLHGGDAREFNRLKEHALCVLDLPDETSSASATFTIVRPVEMFHVGVKTSESRELLSISISGDKGLVGSASIVESHSFGLGQGIRAGHDTGTQLVSKLARPVSFS